MSLMFIFDLKSVVDRYKYLEFIEETKNATEVAVGIEYYRSNNEIKEIENFPEVGKIFND